MKELFKRDSPAQHACRRSQEIDREPERDMKERRKVINLLFLGECGDRALWNICGFTFETENEGIDRVFKSTVLRHMNHLEEVAEDDDTLVDIEVNDGDDYERKAEHFTVCEWTKEYGLTASIGGYS